MYPNSAGIILAGVHQWRASVFERWVPRPLVPIANQPLVEYPLTWLRDGGVTGIDVCANSDTAALRSRLGDGRSREVHIDYYEDHMPRGPAGCVVDALNGRNIEHLVVVDATVLPQAVNLPALLEAHQQSQAALTVVSTSDGALDADRRDALVPVGIYVFSRRALDTVPSQGYEDIKEMLIPRLHQKGEHVAVHVVREAVPRITGADSCLAANGWTLARMANRPQSGNQYWRRGAAIVHSTAFVHDDARLVGPVLIGPGSVIEADAVLVGPTSVGAGCRIGGEAMICRSMIWDRAAVGERCYLDRCIVTYDSAVPSKTHCLGKIHHGRSLRRTWLRRG